MRIYVPTTLRRLATVAAAGRTDAGVIAYAVTPALREWYINGDIEELEYAAMTDAAGDSLRQLAADGGAAPRRVVLAADLPDTMIVPLTGPVEAGSKAMVRITTPVTMAQIVSVHIDADEAIPDLRAAVVVVDAADGGNDDAQFIVDTVEDHALLWYASQEIPDLLRLS